MCSEIRATLPPGEPPTVNSHRDHKSVIIDEPHKRETIDCFFCFAYNNNE